MEQNLYRGGRITDLHPLKETIVEEGNKILQEIIDKCIGAFKPWLQREIEVEGRRIDY